MNQINYVLEEKDQNKLITEKHKNVWTRLNFIKHFLFIVSAISGCNSFFAFASLLYILAELHVLKN